MCLRFICSVDSIKIGEERKHLMMAMWTPLWCEFYSYLIIIYLAGVTIFVGFRLGEIDRQKQREEWRKLQEECCVVERAASSLWIKESLWSRFVWKKAIATKIILHFTINQLNTHRNWIKNATFLAHLENHSSIFVVFLCEDNLVEDEPRMSIKRSSISKHVKRLWNWKENSNLNKTHNMQRQSSKRKKYEKKLRSNPKTAERIEMLGVLNSVSVSRLVSLRSDVDFEEQQKRRHRYWPLKNIIDTFVLQSSKRFEK
jgi:hypothetical protein